jgi:hypothetical protein
LQLGLRFIKAMFYETKPLDTKVFVAVAVLLLASAALACTAPAWRASRIDPMQVLRMEQGNTNCIGLSTLSPGITGLAKTAPRHHQPSEV